MSNKRKMSFRDKALSLKAGAVASTFSVEIDGEQYDLEVRRPTMGSRAKINQDLNKHTDDFLAQTFLPIAHLVYEPGADAPVFSPGDLEAIRESGADAWFDEAMEHAMAVLFPKFQAPETSDETPS